MAFLCARSIWLAYVRACAMAACMAPCWIVVYLRWPTHCSAVPWVPKIYPAAPVASGTLLLCCALATIQRGLTKSSLF